MYEIHFNHTYGIVVTNQLGEVPVLLVPFILVTFGGCFLSKTQSLLELKTSIFALPSSLIAYLA